MIVTRTPLRVSFLGGGSDFPDYYKDHVGACLSMAINRYVYVVLKERFDDKIVLHYTKTETVDELDQVEHDIIRGCMRFVGVTKGIEISTLADVPSEGTGLGSSSSLTVGLLRALYMYTLTHVDTERLAKDACKVEIDILEKGIGKQDQYAAAYGGLNLITFQKNVVQVSRLKKKYWHGLPENLLLFYTGMTRKAKAILDEQRANIPERLGILDKLVKRTLVAAKTLGDGNHSELGAHMDVGWNLKKQLATVTNPVIDKMYLAALEAGAEGGKVCGAGGGGFLLLYVEKANQDAVRETLKDYRELSFDVDNEGSVVILK